MKVSYSWLRELLPIDLSPEELGARLHLLGFGFDGVAALGPQFSGVVVVEVLAVDKHPNADRLKLCQVSTGTETLRIVCGAPNVAVGMRVALARVGAKLPGGKTITLSKIRGEESQGMLCSATELGLPETNGGGLHALPADAPLGTDAADLLGERDAVLEIDVTPNRPDCLSHLGLARELAIVFGKPLKAPDPAPAPPGGQPSPISVVIEAKDACGRYVGRYLAGVKVGASPASITSRLEAVGSRPINAAVDVTNYVLFESGHPLHVFDADKLEGAAIVVRWAKPGETIVALDGKTYTLTEGDLVIADAKKPVAIAGVMGGADTGVTEKTKNIFLEAAHFAPGRVHRTARRLGLRTDSSFRFERGVSPSTASFASARAAELLRKLCGGGESQAVDNYPSPPDVCVIKTTTERLNQILGTEHSPQRVESVLRGLSTSLTTTTEGLRVMPPPYRLDLSTEWDLAEEVARHLGYDSIKDEPAPVRLQRPKTLPAADLAAEARRRLAGLGFLEAYCYDFLSKAELERSGLEAGSAPSVLNPISEDWAHLRPSLLPALLRSAANNLHRGVKGVKLFELGKVYSQEQAEVRERQHLAAVLTGVLPASPDWTAHGAQQEPNRHLFEAKGAAAELLSAWNFELESVGEFPPLLHPRASLQARVDHSVIGWVGLLHPAVEQAWDLPAGSAALVVDLEALVAMPRASAKAAPVSPFPTIVRDLSITVPEDTTYAKVSGCLAGLPALAQVELVDRLAGDAAAAIKIPKGRASLTLRLTFSLPDRTLRDEEVNAAVADGVKRLEKQCSAVLRG